ncbi:hypothetical protein FRC07_011573, partial [Ceratobasidium sp. 392]
MSVSLSAPAVGSTASTPISATSSGPPDLGRPNFHSHSSLTTVSTFKERDIVKGPPSPPEVRVGLTSAGTGNGTKVAEADVKAALGGVNGHSKIPPVIAPKPQGLQARLAGAIAAGASGKSLELNYGNNIIYYFILSVGPGASPPSQPQSEPPPSLTQSPELISPPHNKPLGPPPRHPAVQPAPPVPGTNYAAYVPRVRRAAAGGATSTPPPKPPAPSGGPIPVPYVPRQTPLAIRLQNAARAAAGTPPPGAATASAPVTRPATGTGMRAAVGTGANAVTMITSSSFGGVTTRLPPAPGTPSTPASAASGASGISGTGTGTNAGVAGGTSAALLDIVRSMEGVPKLGCLVVLDLKGNDLRGGVSYIAQVLKRNRTLRSLNLSENKVEVQGLVVLAEALKYNSTLTSLDLSNNLCSSPSLDGIHALRNALTLNTTLRHISLSGTLLNSQGAIAIAEFLPDFPALQHLDLTSNSLDVAGVLALSVGIKVNYGMRCLDLSIVPGEEEMARLCREILKICVRNTERAQAAEEARAGKVAEGVATPTLENGPTMGSVGGGVWDPIEHSALAREAHVNINATAGAGVDPAGRIGVWKMTPGEVLAAARTCADEFAAGGTGEELVKRAREIRAVLVEMIRTERDEGALAEMLVLNDALAPVLSAASPVTGTGLGAVKEGTREEGIRKEMGLGLSIGGEQEAGKQATVEAGAEEAEEGEGEEDGDGEASPAENLSRSWVAEEGEILRKGRVLLSPNELESGADSEALRQELLDAQ